MTRPPTLLFLHIPKVAGTTVRRALWQTVPVEERLTLYPSGAGAHVHPDEIGQIPASRLEKVRIAFGHFSFGIHEHFPGAVRYATALRDPVERVLSQFAALERRRRRAGRDDEGGGGLDLETWVRDPRSGAVHANLMTRRISGAPGALDEGSVEQAIEHLVEWFAVVGLTEATEKVVQAIVEFGGWGDPGPVGRFNVTRDRVPPAEEIVDEIRDLNSLDMALYEEVARRCSDGVMTAV